MANRELTPELALHLARAASAVLIREHQQARGAAHGGVQSAAPGNGRARVLIGRDTRLSGPMLESAMAAGFASMGVDVLLAGIIPTPAIAHLTREYGADAGVVISASHNPVADNGIKFFSRDGFKLPDALEDEIESLLPGMGKPAGQPDGLPRPAGADVGRTIPLEDAAERYIRFLVSVAQAPQPPFRGWRIVIDAGFGAAYQVAPEVFRRLGAEVIALNAEPDGARINVGCGSTHPEMLQEAVRKHRASLGLAHDGDADRLIAVDENGEQVDGDAIMAICARHMLEQGRLQGGKIAVTLYSNLGLRDCLREAGGDVVVTKAGDRYVLEAMLKEGLVLGGEQSGHIIFLRHNTTGDGVLTAVKLLQVLQAKGLSLAEAAKVMRRYPQIMVNVRARRKDEVSTHPAVQTALAQAEALLQGRGRMVVRPSGTEPLVRIMGEGPEEEVVRQAVMHLAQVVERELGA